MDNDLKQFIADNPQFTQDEAISAFNAYKNSISKEPAQSSGLAGYVPDILKRSIEPGEALSPENVGIIGGSMMGGPIGGRLAGTVGQIIGRILGAGTGAAIGNVGETGKISSEAGQAATRGLTVGALNELLAPMMNRIIERGANPLGKLKASSEEIKQAAEKYGIDLTAAQTRQSSVLSQTEALPARFPLGVGPVAKRGAQQSAQIQSAGAGLAEKISPEGMSLMEAGQTYKDTLYPEARQTAKAAIDTAYDNVKKLISVDETRPANVLQEIVDQAKSDVQSAKGVFKSSTENKIISLSNKMQTGNAETPEAAKLLEKTQTPEEWETLAAQLGIDKNKEYTFNGMDQLRKRIRDAKRVAEKAGKDNDFRILSNMENGISEDMHTFADAFPGAKEALDAADKQYAETYAPYFKKGKFPRQLVEQDASQIVYNLVTSNADHPEKIQIVKDAIGNPEGFNKLVSSWWTNIFKESFDKNGSFLPSKVLQQYDKFSPESLDVLLGEHKPVVDEFMSVLKAIGKSEIAGANPSQTSRGVGGFLQFGGAIRVGYNLVSGNLPATIKEGILILSPLALGKIIMSDTGIKWLTIGLNAKPLTQSAITANLRLLAIANAVPEKKIEQSISNQRPLAPSDPGFLKNLVDRNT